MTRARRSSDFASRPHPRTGREPIPVIELVLVLVVAARYGIPWLLDLLGASVVVR